MAFRICAATLKLPIGSLRLREFMTVFGKCRQRLQTFWRQNGCVIKSFPFLLLVVPNLLNPPLPPTYKVSRLQALGGNTNTQEMANVLDSKQLRVKGGKCLRGKRVKGLHKKGSEFRINHKEVLPPWAGCT